MQRTLRPIAFVAAAAALSATAHAQAVLGGGKGGTTFPITISQPGSYKLAGNLVVADPATTAIVVTASNVTLDLAGFTISGPNTCSTQTKTCTYTMPTANGITTHPGVHSLTVRNGTVRGFSARGIAASDLVRLQDVTVSHNGAGGISLNKGALLDGVTASFNGVYLYNQQPAISIGDGVITRSTAVYNVGHAFHGGQLIGVSAMSNGGAGVMSANGITAVQQSRFGQNTGGDFLGASVVSLGGNLCGLAPC